MIRSVLWMIGALLMVGLCTGLRAPEQSRALGQELRFETVDVFVDPAGEVLAAWQLRLIDPTHRIEVVGIEGGEDPSFLEPPFYDPRALVGGELVLAAFDTKNTGPNVEFRVARLHLAVQGTAPTQFELIAEVLAGPDGPIPAATARLSR